MSEHYSGNQPERGCGLLFLTFIAVAASIVIVGLSILAALIGKGII